MLQLNVDISSIFLIIYLLLSSPLGCNTCECETYNYKHLAILSMLKIVLSNNSVNPNICCSNKQLSETNLIICFQVTANHSISLAQFDYTVEFEEEYREAIASGGIF